jgi:hypothetical protein
MTHTQYTPINHLFLSEAADLYSVTRTGWDGNWTYIDALLSKNAYDQAIDPTTTNDTTEGYAEGSHWYNTTGNKVWLCKSALEDNAAWYLIYNAGNPAPLSANWDAGSFQIRCETLYVDLATGGAAPFTVASTTMNTNLNADLLDGVHAAGFVPNPLAADIDLGSYHVQALHFISDCANGTAPYQCTSTDVNTNLNADLLDGVQGAGYITHALSTAENDFLVGGTGATANTFVKKTLAETKTILGVGSSGTSIWNVFPGTPARVGDASFKVTDTTNANLYDQAFPMGTIVKWTKSGGGVQYAMITVASYGSNEVTYTIAGNTFAAGFSDVKYCVHKAMYDTFIVPGTLPGNTATTDISKTIYAQNPIYVVAALPRYKTAATTTKGVWDINDDGATIFTTKPEIAATATTGTMTTGNNISGTTQTAVAEGSAITLDYDSGHASTPGADAYITIYWMPVSWGIQS